MWSCVNEMLNTSSMIAACGDSLGPIHATAHALMQKAEHCTDEADRSEAMGQAVLDAVLEGGPMAAQIVKRMQDPNEFMHTLREIQGLLEMGALQQPSAQAGGGSAQ